MGDARQMSRATDSSEPPRRRDSSSAMSTASQSASAVSSRRRRRGLRRPFHDLRARPRRRAGSETSRRPSAPAPASTCSISAGRADRQGAHREQPAARVRSPTRSWLEQLSRSLLEQLRAELGQSPDGLPAQTYRQRETLFAVATGSRGPGPEFEERRANRACASLWSALLARSSPRRALRARDATSRS